MGQPEAEARPAPQGVIFVEGEGASPAFAALEAKDIFLARAGSGFLRTAAEALFQVAGVCQRPPQVTVTGDAVWEVSVPQGALITAASTECRPARAVARERIALGSGRPHMTAITGLAPALRVVAPVSILAHFASQPPGVGGAEALSGLRVTRVVCMRAVTG